MTGGAPGLPRTVQTAVEARERSASPRTQLARRRISPARFQRDRSHPASPASQLPGGFLTRPSACDSLLNSLLCISSPFCGHSPGTCWEWPFRAVNSRFGRASLVARPLALQAPRKARGRSIQGRRQGDSPRFLSRVLVPCGHSWLPPQDLPLGSQEVVGPSLRKEEQKKR